MKDVLIGAGIVGLLYIIAHKKVVTHTTNTTVNAAQQVANNLHSNIVGTMDIGGGGGGGFDAGGGGGILWGGGGFNAARAAWEFANWVDSIQIGGYPQTTGVIYYHEPEAQGQ